MRWRHGRQPTAHELTLWRRMVHDVERLDGSSPEQAEPQPTDGAPKPEPPVVVAAPMPQTSSRAAPTTAPPSAATVDRRMWQRLRRGHQPVDARLDLHGMTQDQAYSSVSAFLGRQQARGSRCVLIITGSGMRSGGGILRTMTPRWLQSPPNDARVVGFTTAGRIHGGDGALYVLLRRAKS